MSRKPDSTFATYPEAFHAYYMAESAYGVALCCTDATLIPRSTFRCQLYGHEVRLENCAVEDDPYCCIHCGRRFPGSASHYIGGGLFGPSKVIQ